MDARTGEHRERSFPAGRVGACRVPRPCRSHAGTALPPQPASPVPSCLLLANAKIHRSQEPEVIEGMNAEVPRRCRKHRCNASTDDVRSNEPSLKKEAQFAASRIRSNCVKPVNAKRNVPYNGGEHHHSSHRISERNRSLFHVKHRREAAHNRSVKLAARRISTHRGATSFRRRHHAAPPKVSRSIPSQRRVTGSSERAWKLSTAAGGKKSCQQELSCVFAARRPPEKCSAARKAQKYMRACARRRSWVHRESREQSE